jgi:hypothetical protein
MFENRMLRKTFEPKRDQVIGGHVARKRREMYIGFWRESQKERDH